MNEQSDSDRQWQLVRMLHYSLLPFCYVSYDYNCHLVTIWQEHVVLHWNYFSTVKMTDRELCDMLNNNHMKQQNHWAWSGVQYVKYRCGCKEATIHKMWMLYTHFPPSSTEDCYNHRRFMVGTQDRCHPFSIQPRMNIVPFYYGFIYDNGQKVSWSLCSWPLTFCI